MYYNGNFVTQDYKKAFDYFEESQKQDGYYMIGLMNYNGYYVDTNYEEAFKIFSKLEEIDNRAKLMLGKMFCYGYYVERNYNRANEIFSYLVQNYNDKEAKHMIEMIEYLKNGKNPSDGVYF